MNLMLHNLLYPRHQVMLLCFPIMTLVPNLHGCAGDSEASDSVNTALITVKNEPPTQYSLNRFELQNDVMTSMQILKWTSSNPPIGFQANPRLLEGSNPLSSLIFSYYVPGPGDERLEAENRYCQRDCQGMSTVSVDTAQRKLILDLSMSFDTDIDGCSTRYCITVAADQSNIYTTCKDKSECKDPFWGCHCTMVLPCKGNVARDASDLCPNPDFKKDKLGISITAHAELTENMLQSN